MARVSMMSKSRAPLTQSEIEFARKNYAMGVRPAYVAQQLKCSARTISKWYAKFGGKVPSERKHVTAHVSKPASDKPPWAPARPNLYTSNFEPT